MEPLRILVADDHALMRKSVRALLEGDPGLRVIGEAATGLETIAQVALTRPDLVILDLHMPGLEGIEVATQIRQTHPETRIIVFTADLTPGVERQAQAAGIHRCVSKSGPPQELAAAVAALLNHWDHAAALLLPQALGPADPATLLPAEAKARLSGVPGLPEASRSTVLELPKDASAMDELGHKAQ